MFVTKCPVKHIFASINLVGLHWKVRYCFLLRNCKWRHLLDYVSGITLTKLRWLFFAFKQQMITIILFLVICDVRCASFQNSRFDFVTNPLIRTGSAFRITKLRTKPNNVCPFGESANRNMLLVYMFMVIWYTETFCAQTYRDIDNCKLAQYNMWQVFVPSTIVSVILKYARD